MNQEFLRSVLCSSAEHVEQFCRGWVVIYVLMFISTGSMPNFLVNR
jgi:hypothetical protein